MKTKIFSLVAMLVCATMMSAQTFNRIVVNIEIGEEYDDLYLIESPSFTDEFENSYDEVKLFTGSDIYVYGKTAYGNQSAVYTNDLQGAYIGFKAEVSGTARITFSDLQSDLADVTTYYLYDTENGQYTPISTSEHYDFAVVADQNVANRFIILKPVKVTTNEDGWASFANNVALAPLGGLKAYYAEYDQANAAVDLHETEMIPAAEGVFLKGAALTEYTLTPNVTGLSASVEQNDLVGCVAYTDVTAVTDAIYCIRNVGGVSALYQFVGANIPAGKAYLPIATGGAPAPARIALHFAGEQGIEDVKADVKAEKFVENGQIFIRRGNEVFNIQGQIVK
jgi:hypothetical protein